MNDSYVIFNSISLLTDFLKKETILIRKIKKSKLKYSCDHNILYFNETDIIYKLELKKHD